MAFDRLQQEGRYLLVYKVVSEVPVEAQIGEISTSLAVVQDILGVLEHIDHEKYGVIRGHLVVAVEHLGYVGERRGCVQRCLMVSRGAPNLHYRGDDLVLGVLIIIFIIVQFIDVFANQIFYLALVEVVIL